MDLTIRKHVTYMEDIFIEGGRSGSPLKLCAVAAVITNPWAGASFVEDLKPAILSVAPQLARGLVPPLLDLCGGADKIEAFGKAAVVGANGEVEHGSALIHTLRFGNIYRDAVGGKSYLSFTNTRGGTNASIAIPLVHKNDSGLRSHYLTIQFAINDAPGPDEIVVVIGAATGGRPNARIGNRYEDMAELNATG